MNMNDLKFKDEIQKMEYEPLDKTEITLIRTSLILGITLLVVFYFLSNVLFKHETPEQPPKPVSAIVETVVSTKC